MSASFGWAEPISVRIASVVSDSQASRWATSFVSSEMPDTLTASSAFVYGPAPVLLEARLFCNGSRMTWPLRQVCVPNACVVADCAGQSFGLVICI